MASRRRPPPRAAASRRLRPGAPHARRDPGDRLRDHDHLLGGWVFALGVARARPRLPARAVRDVRARAAGAAGGASSASPGWSSRRALGDERQVLLALVAFVPLLFLLARGDARPRADPLSLGRRPIARRLWIGLALAHAVLLRGLDHGGALVVMVLLGTFIGDTGAYLGGRAFGTRQLAPRISPNKTVEGLRHRRCVVGTRVGLVRRAAPTGTGSAASTALLLGVAVAIAAPLGDLFESLIKRDVGHEGHRRPVRRPRRRAGPPRRRAVRARRRLLRLAGAVMSDDDAHGAVRLATSIRARWASPPAV